MFGEIRRRARRWDRVDSVLDGKAAMKPRVFGGFDATGQFAAGWHGSRNELGEHEENGSPTNP
jgi:hypothetical protein